MVRLSIDGARHTGNYRCECECGFAWTGQGEAITTYSWAPAMPVAECVLHIRDQHPRSQYDLSFTEHFTDWLVGYWHTANARIAARPAALPYNKRERWPV